MNVQSVVDPAATVIPVTLAVDTEPLSQVTLSNSNPDSVPRFSATSYVLSGDNPVNVTVLDDDVSIVASPKVPVTPAPVELVTKSNEPSPPIVTFVILSEPRALLVNVHSTGVAATRVIDDGSFPLSQVTLSNSHPARKSSDTSNVPGRRSGNVMEPIPSLVGMLNEPSALLLKSNVASPPLVFLTIVIELG